MLPFPITALSFACLIIPSPLNAVLYLPERILQILSLCLSGNVMFPFILKPSLLSFMLTFNLVTFAVYAVISQLCTHKIHTIKTKIKTLEFPSAVVCTLLSFPPKHQQAFFCTLPVFSLPLLLRAILPIAPYNPNLFSYILRYNYSTFLPPSFIFPSRTSLSGRR